VKAPTEMRRTNVSPKLRSSKMNNGMRRLLSSEVVDADKLNESCEEVILVCDEVALCTDNARHASDLRLRKSIL
jgi:hypothetical protein